MEKKIITSVMALMMIASMYFLARIAAVYTMSYREEAERGKVEQPKAAGVKIVIDAGHGGSDPGKVGVNGALEKDINLAVAILVQKKLVKAGYEVVMTRTEEKVQGKKEGQGETSGKAADMHRRIEIINECGAQALISIHQNSYGSASVRGPQVFYYNSSAEGLKFAQIMQDQLNTGMEVKRPRGAKANDNYYLLRKSKITAVIVECGFLSNPDEAELLCTPEYQEKLAENIFQAVCTYTDGG